MAYESGDLLQNEKESTLWFDSKFGSPYLHGVRSETALIVLLGLARVATAQPPADGNEVGRKETKFSVEDAAKVPAETKKTLVEKKLAEQRAALARISALTRDAKLERDMILFTTLEAKLRQVKGLLRISERASTNMYDAFRNGDDQAVNYSYTKISLAHARTMMLLAEAEQSTGVNAVYTGTTQVTLIRDGEFVRDTVTPIGSPPGPQTPPTASRF